MFINNQLLQTEAALNNAISFFGKLKNIPIFAPHLTIYMQVTKEVKKNLFKEFGGNEANTGSTEGQIALFTARINHISDHLKTNKNDHANTRSLLKLVGKRRRLLNYLMREDLNGYRSLIEKLNIRK